MHANPIEERQIQIFVLNIQHKHADVHSISSYCDSTAAAQSGSGFSFASSLLSDRIVCPILNPGMSGRMLSGTPRFAAQKRGTPSSEAKGSKENLVIDRIRNRPVRVPRGFDAVAFWRTHASERASMCVVDLGQTKPLVKNSPAKSRLLESLEGVPISSKSPITHTHSHTRCPFSHLDQKLCLEHKPSNPSPQLRTRKLGSNAKPSIVANTKQEGIMLHRGSITNEQKKQQGPLG